jgi:hypothetical protein
MVVRRRDLPGSSDYFTASAEHGHVRQAFVLILVVLAGCSGVFGSATTESGPSVTPAPVPTVSEQGITLPQTDDGRPAVGRLITAHRRALSTRAFHRRTVVDGSLSTTDVWVDRDAKRSRVRRVTSTTIDVVVEDGHRYERAENRSVLSERASDGLPGVESASGFFLLQRYVAGLIYNRTGTTTKNGTELAVLRANTTNSTISRSGSRTVVAADSTLYVDRDGVIRAMDHRERYADGTVRTLRVRVWTGEDSVAMPEWFTGREGATAAYTGRQND